MSLWLPPRYYWGKKMPRHYKIPDHWWHIIQATTIWQIWKVRCSRCLDHKPSLPYFIQCKVWHHLKLYLCEAWQNCSEEFNTWQISLQTTQRRMLADYGDNQMVFLFSGSKLVLPTLPPRVQWGWIYVSCPSGLLDKFSTPTDVGWWYWLTQASSPPLGLLVHSSCF